jgi:hypothetical protein
MAFGAAEIGRIASEELLGPMFLNKRNAPPAGLRFVR